jgi:Domain of unknown function (DUF397)
MSTTTWRKSSYSQDVNSDCVEVAFGRTGAAVRDSKNTGGPVLRVGVVAWSRFLTAHR